MCAFHHHTVHRRAISITRLAGGWEFRDQRGRLIGAGGAPPETDPPGRAGLCPESDLPSMRPDVREAPLRAEAEQLCLAV
jgi:hypothetical protein